MTNLNRAPTPLYQPAPEFSAHEEALIERIAHRTAELLSQQAAAVAVATPSPNTGTLPELLTRDEAAAVLRCHPLTLQRRTQALDIPTVRQGRSVRYRREDVLRVAREGWA